jgi:hypothetical protein
MIFKKLLCFASLLLLASCTTTHSNTDLINKTPDITPLMTETIDLDVVKISIEDLSLAGSFHESSITVAPKDVLIKWLKNSIRSTGITGSLTMIINNANLQKVDYEPGQYKYKANYNVTFKISKNEGKHLSTAELNVIVENYRVIDNKISNKEKQQILNAQIEELTRLLEAEVLEKSDIYFADYLTAKKSKKYADRK